MSALLTQAISDQPEVIFFSDDTLLAKQITTKLQTQGLTVRSFGFSEIRDAAIVSLCETAYKTIFLLEPTKKNLLEKIAQNIPQQVLAQCIVPVITPCFSSAPKLQFWQKVSHLQADFLSQLNYLLPNTQCIFLRDCIDIPIVSPLAEVFSQLPAQQLLLPELSIAPTKLSVSLEEIQRAIFHPTRSSILIQGTEVSGAAFFAQAIEIYSRIHQCKLQTSVTPVETTTTIPFYVVVEEVEINLESLSTEYIKTLPSPQHWRPLFSLASEQKKTEVVESQAATYPEPAPPPAVKKFSPSVATNVVSDITSLFTLSHQKHQAVRSKEVSTVEKKISKKKKKNTALFLLGLVSTGVTLGTLFLAGFFWLSVFLTERTVLQELANLFSDSGEQAETGGWSQRWNSLLAVQADSYGSILDIALVSKAEKILAVAAVLQSYRELVPQARQTEQTLVQHLFGQTDSDLSLLAQNATTQSQSSYELLATLESELSGVLSETEEHKQLQTKLTNTLLELRGEVALSQQITPLLPAMGGIRSKQTYAVLFQNSQELRPTGGFLQSIAFVTLAQGSVIDVQTIGSYELDAAIGGVVTPPQDIERLLGESNWFARDANWDPDFPSTATTIRWFVDRARNIQLSGVLALDTQGMAEIIEALGPVDLPEYNEVITHKNLFERLEYHSEAVLVPESGAKDYSAALLDRVLQKILAAPVEKFPTLLQSTRLAAEGQHLLFSFTDETQQSAFTALGWSGSILHPPCPSQLTATTCVVDPLYQVEANVGVNKANYYLTRAISHQVALSTTQALHTRIVEYNNTAQSNSWPKGPYKAYVRYYLAPNSEFSQLLVNGSPISVQNLVVSREHGRTLVGATITVPVGASVTTQLEYVTPLTTKSGSSAYVFFNQKQPGTNAAPLAVTLSYPPELQPEKIAPQAEVTDTAIIFSDKEEKSRMYGAKFF